MPVVIVLDWLIQSPPRPLAYSKLWVWLLPPVLYLVYALVRGTAINWYPYPFLNRATVGGCGAVALYCLGITVAFLAVSVVLAVTANKLRPLVRPAAKAPVAAYANDPRKGVSVAVTAAPHETTSQDYSTEAHNRSLLDHGPHMRRLADRPTGGWSTDFIWCVF